MLCPFQLINTRVWSKLNTIACWFVCKHWSTECVNCHDKKTATNNLFLQIAFTLDMTIRNKWIRHANTHLRNSRLYYFNLIRYDCIDHANFLSVRPSLEIPLPFATLINHREFGSSSKFLTPPTFFVLTNPLPKTRIHENTCRTAPIYIPLVAITSRDSHRKKNVLFCNNKLTSSGTTFRNQLRKHGLGFRSHLLFPNRAMWFIMKFYSLLMYFRCGDLFVTCMWTYRKI